jgi:hypothetical protein
MKASDVLATAATLVDGDRDKTHGPERANFKATAALWQAYLDNRKPGPMTPGDAAAQMMLTKMARAMMGAPVADHWIDMIGYASIWAEWALGQAKQNDASASVPPKTNPFAVRWFNPLDHDDWDVTGNRLRTSIPSRAQNGEWLQNP